MLAHTHNLWNDCSTRPFNTKDIRQIFQVDRSGLTNAVYRIAQPRHTEIT